MIRKAKRGIAGVVNLRKNPYDVYIGRPSFWGNPFEIGKDGNRYEVLIKYEDYLNANPEMLAKLKELDGKVLGCFCKPKPCHGDVLIKVRLEQLEQEEQEAQPTSKEVNTD